MFEVGGHDQKQGVFNSKKVAGCLQNVPSEVGSYKPVVAYKVVNREPKVQLHVEIQHHRVPLQTAHYDPLEDLRES